MSPGPAVYEPSGPGSPVRSARPSTLVPSGGPTDRTLRDLAARLRDPTPSPSFPLSSPANGAGASRASAELTRGAAAALRPAVTPSISTRIHARGTLAPRQVGPGIGEGTTGPSGPGPTPALVLCVTCRQPIARNEILGISFCRIHGLSRAFVFVPLARARLSGA